MSAVNPDDAGSWNLQGVALAKAGQIDEARKSFQRAIALSPRLTSAWLNLGRSYVTRADDATAITEGIRAYRRALALSPDSAEAHHQLALLLQWEGKYRESLEHLDRLPRADQHRIATLAIRCGDEAALQHAAAARTAADQLLAAEGLDAGDVLAILPLASAHDEALALHLLDGINARGLANAETLSFEASLFERRGNLGSAQSRYERAFAASPQSAAALIDLARVEWKRKEFEKALGYLAHARDLEPGNAGVHYFFGLTSNELHLPLEARKSLERALELEPENPYYNYALGAVRLQWKEAAGAIPYLAKYASARPGDARGHLALATAYFYSDQMENAKRELQLLIDKGDASSGLFYLRGSIRMQEGDANGAREDFRKLVMLEPKWAAAHAELGALLLEAQDLDGARRETEASLAIDPKNYTANRTLMRIFKAAQDPRYAEQVKALQLLANDSDNQMRFLERTLEVRAW